MGLIDTIKDWLGKLLNIGEEAKENIQKGLQDLWNELPEETREGISRFVEDVKPDLEDVAYITGTLNPIGRAAGFAGFMIEESVQMIIFGIWQSIQAGAYEKAKDLVALGRDVLNKGKDILFGKVKPEGEPYAFILYDGTKRSGGLSTFSLLVREVYAKVFEAYEASLSAHERLIDERIEFREKRGIVDTKLITATVKSPFTGELFDVKVEGVPGEVRTRYILDSEGNIFKVRIPIP